LSVQPANLERVRAAMLADVEDNAGTGVESRVKDFPVSGKTGTAEVKRGNTLIDKIVWFVSFAPFDHPRYVVIVMVESGGSGGRTAAPVAGRIYKYVHERELAAGRAGVAGN
jgi:penicillin-binding protein 2